MVRQVSRSLVTLTKVNSKFAGPLPSGASSGQATASGTVRLGYGTKHWYDLDADYLQKIDAWFNRRLFIPAFEMSDETIARFVARLRPINLSL